MMKLGIEVNRNVCKKVSIFCAGVAVGYVSMLGLTYFMIHTAIDPRMAVYYALAYTTSNLYSTLFVVAFCLTLFIIYERYSVMNDFIKSNFKTEDEDAIKVFDKKSNTPEKLIIKLADLHDMLNDVVIIMNQCFCFEVSSFDFIQRFTNRSFRSDHAFLRFMFSFQHLQYIRFVSNLHA